MPIVLAGGPSVTDYPRQAVTNMAGWGFTFAVNHVAFDFPCDVIVSIDPWMPKRNVDKLKALGKPIITRPWEGFKELGLDFIYLPDNCFEKCYYSGMIAAKISDALAKEDKWSKSYVLGIDASTGRYQGHKGDDMKWDYNKAPLDAYEAMGLGHTVNLSIHSKVSCWPKYSKLPTPPWCAVLLEYRTTAIQWLRDNAAGLFK